MKRNKHLLLSFLSVSSVLIGGGFCNQAIASLAPESGVRLYTNAQFSGTPLLFSPGKTGQITLQPAHRNTISSLIVPDGFTVILTDSEDEQSRTYQAGEHPSVGETMNNKADIVTIVPA